jgi:hypothetical protein
MKWPSARLIEPWLIVVAGLPVMASLTVMSRRDIPIAESEAVRLAEDFIIRNVYTDPPPDPDRRKLTPEPIPFASSIEDELRHRHDTLERKADGAYGGDGGWIVYFRYKKSRVDPGARRTVIMDARGRRLRMIHQNAYWFFAESCG